MKDYMNFRLMAICAELFPMIPVNLHIPIRTALSRTPVSFAYFR
jgi:hypothetical protein